jgi:hypothetical protein
MIMINFKKLYNYFILNIANLYFLCFKKYFNLIFEFLIIHLFLIIIF